MESSSISVAVRVRPFSDKEKAQLSSTYGHGPTLFGSDQSSSAALSTPQPPRASTTGGLRKILKVLDDRILVFDPPETNAVASFQRANFPVMGKKVKDIRFCFDKVFDEDCGQEEIYDGSAKELVGHVMNGFHSTVFAYGATGCGKTHTISGSNSQPGIVFLIMKDLFARIAAKSHDTDFSLTVSYLEIYNETIRDLLHPESGPLQLRESNGMAAPAGLSTKEPTCATDVVEWITLGNQNRTVNATEANATSSRSHAVLSVTVSQKPRAGGMTDNTQTASLSVIDLAGSERASVTKNKGDRLIEGANINRSLLALGNCINALCDPRKRGHVPYRDSKLTRLLKQSLGGNCKTVMIVCLSPSSAHYDETHNALQYANRAKEIKTKAVRNVISVDRHVGEYCRQILEQAAQIQQLQAQLVGQSTAAGIEEREADAKAVQFARQKLVASWEQGHDRLVYSERARIEREGVDNILSVLKQWRTTTFAGVDGASPSSALVAASTVALVKAGCDHLVQSLSQSSSRLSSEMSASNSLDMYAVMCKNLSNSIRANHPHAVAQFDLEVKVLDLRLQAALSGAREQGLLESMKVQARAMHSMCEARAKVGAAIDDARAEGNEGEQNLRRFSDAIDSANRAAFLALADSGSFAGTKRDAGARSPLEPHSPWGGELGRKAPREALEGFGSTPTGSMAASPMRPSSATFTKSSPRKGVTFKARRELGSPKKRKEVQWRDEVGNGDGDLEDVKWQDPSTPETSATGSLRSGTSPMPPAPRPLFTLTAPINPWTPADTSTAADKMLQSVQQRSATGSFRNRISSVPSVLPSLSENGAPFSFLRDDPHPSTSSSRLPFVDLANTSVSSNGSSASESYSMAGPSGLYAPLVSSSSSKKPSEPETPRRSASRVRRVSQIGPQRSAKPNRRTSFIAPPTPQPGATFRKASRGATSSFFAPPASAVRKNPTPRKVMAMMFQLLLDHLVKVPGPTRVVANLTVGGHAIPSESQTSSAPLPAKSSAPPTTSSTDTKSRPPESNILPPSAKQVPFGPAFLSTCQELATSHAQAQKLLALLSTAREALAASRHREDKLHTQLVALNSVETALSIQLVEIREVVAHWRCVEQSRRDVGRTRESDLQARLRAAEQLGGAAAFLYSGALEGA